MLDGVIRAWVVLLVEGICYGFGVGLLSLLLSMIHYANIGSMNVARNLCMQPVVKEIVTPHIIRVGKISLSP